MWRRGPVDKSRIVNCWKNPAAGPLPGVDRGCGVTRDFFAADGKGIPPALALLNAGGYQIGEAADTVAWKRWAMRA